MYFETINTKMKIKKIVFKYLVCLFTLGTFLLLLPQVLFAQNKLPFIESITSDTFNGKYQHIIIKYDQDNRVTKIIETNCKTQKKSPTDVFPLIDTLSIQTFTYNGRSKNPVSRKITNFKFDPVEKAAYWTYTQNYIFIYRKGKHVQDSIMNKRNRLRVDEDNKDNDKPYYWKGKIEYSNKAIVYHVDRNYLSKHMYESTYGSTTEILINNQHNIEKESEEELIKSHTAPNPPYYTYTKFDKAINPFSYLNIAGSIPNEKIYLSYNINFLIGKKVDYTEPGYTDFNWYFFNQNNITNYSITRGETDSDFSDVIHLSYNYNKFNLPTQCFAEIRKEYRSDGTLVGTHQKRFTFRYKN